MGLTHFLASDFDFELPPELIAQHPTPARDQSRLLLLTERGPSHHTFSALPELLRQTVGAGALLVLNDTQVLPARLRARKLRALDGAAALGGQVELLLCEPSPAAAGDKPRWRCLYRASKPLRPGSWLQLLADAGATAARKEAADAAATVAGLAQVLTNEGGGYVVVEFAVASAEELLALLGRIGEVPLHSSSFIPPKAGAWTWQVSLPFFVDDPAARPTTLRLLVATRLERVMIPFDLKNVPVADAR